LDVWWVQKRGAGERWAVRKDFTSFGGELVRTGKKTKREVTVAEGRRALKTMCVKDSYAPTKRIERGEKKDYPGENNIN